MTLSTSQPNIDWSVRAFDDDDLVISQQFRSGCLDCGDILAHPKYKKEGILGALLLPHSLIQFGVGWFRSIPMGYLGQDPSLELGTDSLTPDLVDDFSLKLLSSIFTATADSPKYTASGGLSDLFKSNMFKDAASISSITTKKTKAIQDYITDKANANIFPKRKLSSSLSPLSHVSPVSSPQISNTLKSPKSKSKKDKETPIASPAALNTTEIDVKDESPQQGDLQHNSPIVEKSPSNMPEPVAFSTEESKPSDLKRTSPDPSLDSPRKSQRLTSPTPVSPSNPKSHEVTTLASSDIPTTQVTENKNTTIASPDIPDTLVTENKDATIASPDIPATQVTEDKDTTIASSDIPAAQVTEDKHTTIASSDIPATQVTENKDITSASSDIPATQVTETKNTIDDLPEIEHPSDCTSPKKLAKVDVELSQNDKSTEETNGSNGIIEAPISPHESANKLENDEEEKSSKTDLDSFNKSPSPKPVSPSKSSLSLLSRSPSPTPDNNVNLSKEYRESWQNIEKVGYPAQALPSLAEELQDSYWTKFYKPTDAFPMKMFSKYTIHFFTSARTESGPLPSEIDLDGPPDIVADNMIALVRKIYDRAGSSMSHDLKATVNQALCVIGRYLSDKSTSVIDDFITRNYQPVNKKVSSADRIAIVARFVSRVWDSRSPISRMSNLHVNFYKLAGLLGEQGTNSIVSALQHLQEKYPPIYD